MPQNQFSVDVFDPQKAMAAGEEGYSSIQKLMQGRQIQQARQEAAQHIASGGDPKNALAVLLGVGDDKGAATLATVMHNQQTGDYQNRSLEQHGSQFAVTSAESARHNKATEGQAAATLAQAAEKPTVLPPGSGLVDRKGNILREPTSDGLLDEDTITAMAHQLKAGDTSVLTNLGRGAQGAQNVIAVRRKVAQLNSAQGESGAEQANRNAEMMGVKAGQRTLGTKQANIEMAATEFEQVLPVVQKASQAVDRTRFPDLNRIIQAYEQKTGDPNIVAFGGAVNTLVNLYSRAISPSGTPTVHDKEHAREILNKAWSQGQFDAAVGMMKQEITAALSSPEKVREEMRKRFLGGQGGAKAAPASNAGAPQRINSAAERDALPPGTPYIAPDGSQRIKQ